MLLRFTPCAIFVVVTGIAALWGEGAVGISAARAADLVAGYDRQAAPQAYRPLRHRQLVSVRHVRSHYVREECDLLSIHEPGHVDQATRVRLVNICHKPVF